MKKSNFYLHKQLLVRELELQERIVAHHLQKPFNVAEVVLSEGVLKKIGFSKPFVHMLHTKFNQLHSSIHKLKGVASIVKEIQRFIQKI
ncbi:hypothetical protein FHR24_001603 [Wenyingzhuangia heitensis]|uniref:Uncharacterized protein n=1 Tax=Wenyingzhuangia heitensis TaxID=1487859 RepID=A0ABX0U8K5_9FLAO|nr:hypothetical protein [Wenyingzhuangia heitensis]NIJ45164.1 hypothetical protein [Wenyingzhuangia heitensis]